MLKSNFNCYTKHAKGWYQAGYICFQNSKKGLRAEPAEGPGV